MNPAFLAKLQALHSQKNIPNAPQGVSISNVPNRSTRAIVFSKVLVVPPGLGKAKVNSLINMGAVIAESVDMNYPEDSIKDFVSTVNVIKPTIIIAGSRGTELLRELLKNTNVTHYPKCIILFGPVHLQAFFKAVKKDTQVKILVVHGTKDGNEKIESVRSLVQKFNAKLVEVTNQGHSLNVTQTNLRKLIGFVA